MKNIKLLLAFFLFATPIIAMESLVKDSEIQKIVQEIDLAKKTKHEQLGQLIYHAPFPTQVSLKDYRILKSLCKPPYAKLLERLVVRKVIDPNTYCNYKRGDSNICRCGLLAEALHLALTNNENLIAVNVLLRDKAANLNQEQSTLIEAKSTLLAKDMLPLERVLYVRASVAAFKLLLQHGADPNARNTRGVSPLMSAISLYDGVVENRLRIYECLKALLAAGAKIDKPSTTPYRDIVTTPWMYVQQGLRANELLDLFRQYPNNLMTKQYYL